MTTLIATPINLHLKTVPNWSKRAQTIARIFKFEGFLDSIKFVRRIATKAEAAQHHSDINIRWNKVTSVLTTHEEGGPTKKKISRWPGNVMKFFRSLLAQTDLPAIGSVASGRVTPHGANIGFLYSSIMKIRTSLENGKPSAMPWITPARLSRGTDKWPWFVEARSQAAK